MNKRKIVLLAAALLMVGIMGFGGTLAYFLDADVADNVFTIGNVQIDLKENFVDESKLVPVTYDPTTGERKPDNVVNKDVFVTNVGTEECYVRVHIAIPTILDDGDPNFDASKNILHFNADEASYQNGFWNWGVEPDDNDVLEGSAMVNGDWNFYTTTINEVEYNVYVVTYESILTAEATTLHYAMSQVYMDKNVTNQDITNIKNGWTDDDGTVHAGIGNNWHIYVAAEGTQADGFANAFEALNVSFGVPGTYNDKIDWAGVGTYVDENDPS